MTSPEDDDAEEALRRALSEAVSGVEPGTDGLDKIRVRIGTRPPRPWLLSVLVGVVDRVRYWTWHGHWAWQDSLPRPGAHRERLSRRSAFPQRGSGRLRLVTVLGGAAVIAGIALNVQPFRHAILAASTALNGGSGTLWATAGTDGNGATTVGTAAPTASGARAVAGTGQPSAVTRSGTAAPTPTTRAKCAPPVLPGAAGGTSSATGARPSATPATQAHGTAAAVPVAPAQPYSAGQPYNTGQPYNAGQPYNTNAQAQTCPVAHPTGSPSPAPTKSPSPSAPPLATSPNASSGTSSASSSTATSSIATSSTASSALTTSPAGSTPSASPTATPAEPPADGSTSPGLSVPPSRPRSGLQRTESRGPDAPAANRQGTSQR